MTDKCPHCGLAPQDYSPLTLSMREVKSVTDAAYEVLEEVEQEGREFTRGEKLLLASCELNAKLGLYVEASNRDAAKIAKIELATKLALIMASNSAAPETAEQRQLRIFDEIRRAMAE
jgi:hypothetical protein